MTGNILPGYTQSLYRSNGDQANNRTARWVQGHKDQYEEVRCTKDPLEVKLAMNGTVRRTKGGGAIKVDLSTADKTIRRPDSAPDLISVDEKPPAGVGRGTARKTTPGGSRNKRTNSNNTNQSSSSRDRSNSSDREDSVTASSVTTVTTTAAVNGTNESGTNGVKQPPPVPPRKTGVSPGGRKQVVFTGIDDSTSSESSDSTVELEPRTLAKLGLDRQPTTDSETEQDNLDQEEGEMKISGLKEMIQKKRMMMSQSQAS